MPCSRCDQPNRFAAIREIPAGQRVVPSTNEYFPSSVSGSDTVTDQPPGRASTEFARLTILALAKLFSTREEDSTIFN